MFASARPLAFSLASFKMAVSDSCRVFLFLREIHYFLNEGNMFFIIEIARKSY